MDIGRPPALDEIKKREICAILAVGCTRAIAARYVGCHPDTIRNTAGRDAEFAMAIERAESRHEIIHLTHINKAAEEGRYWRAAAWALERKYPDRYAARSPDVITVEQIARVLAQFAEVMLEEVPAGESRQRILTRLNDLSTALRASAAKGALP
jgi:hypothetical protein